MGSDLARVWDEVRTRILDWGLKSDEDRRMVMLFDHEIGLKFKCCKMFLHLSMMYYLQHKTNICV